QANTVALATARQWAAQQLGVDVSQDGLWSLPPIPVLAGTPHASVLKALAILGMGRSCVETLPTQPGRQAVDLDAMAERLAAQHGAPSIVVASAGEVNTGDFDDLATLGELCRRHRAWLHVDAAFGLFAACDPEQAHLLNGLELADSLATDGHKWLNVPYDSGIVFTRHLEHQEAVFKAVAAYLGAGPDLLHRTPENSRRFRALPAWMTLMAYGREGHRELVARCCRLARSLGERITASEHYELLAPVHLDIVCFALRERKGEDEAQRRDRVLDRLLDDGRVYLTPTVFDGRPGMRAAFVNWRTGEGDIDLIVEALEGAVG
ncbi:MAG: pyridoxal-dependent decarboxylase, partial [Acidobacteriota bacterium]